MSTHTHTNTHRDTFDYTKNVDVRSRHTHTHSKINGQERASNTLSSLVCVCVWCVWWCVCDVCGVYVCAGHRSRNGSLCFNKSLLDGAVEP